MTGSHHGPGSIQRGQTGYTHSTRWPSVTPTARILPLSQRSQMYTQLPCSPNYYIRILFDTI